MAYSEETRKETCPRCAKINHIVIAYAGDDRANESKEVQCLVCSAPLKGATCLAIFSGATPEDAEAPLRRLQNRNSG